MVDSDRGERVRTVMDDINRYFGSVGAHYGFEDPHDEEDEEN